jgi:predicted PurR-regulated permease PerM
MEEIKTSKTAQGLGIAGFVLALIAIFLSFIPFVGIAAMIPAIIAIVFTAIALSKTVKHDQIRGLIIAGLIISVVAFAISVSQIYIGKKISNIGNKVDKIEAFSKELQKGMDDEFTKKDMEELEKAMEELEGEIEQITEENAEEIGRAAGKALKEFTKEVKKAKEVLKDSTEE